MAAATVRGCIGEADALDTATIVSREFLALGGHRQFGAAMLGGETSGAEAQFLTKAFAFAGQFDAFNERFCRAELELNPAGHFLGQNAEFVQFHRCRNGRAEGDRVEALLVTDEIDVGQRFEVLDARIRAQRPSGFILKAARGFPVFRLVLNGEVGFIDLRDTAAGDGAAKTGLVRQQVWLAVGFARGRHRFGGDIVSAFELDVARVPGRHCASFVDNVHQDLGAISRQSLAGDAVALQDFLARSRCGEEGLAITDFGAAGAANGDGFHILRAKHSADA